MLEYLYNLLMNLYNDVDEIVPNLWLGNADSALNVDFLVKNDINVIVNCTKNKPFVDQQNNHFDKFIETFRIPVDDSLLDKDIDSMTEYLKVIIPLLLNKYTVEKKNILIHCHMGKQRSAIVIACLLKVLIDFNYISTEISKDIDDKQQFDEICNYILSKRPQAFTFGYRINFKKSFYKFFNIKE